MLRKIGFTTVALLIATSAAFADDIVGNWKTDSGETAAIAGTGPFSITLQTGKYTGKRIGSLNAGGDGRYSGEITDPATDKTYSGKAALSGNSLKMSGCVLGGLICKTQNWKRN
ncbi:MULTISPECIES: DUF2147 domain-containing protein [Mesorhizobium]|uniref:DUF2147 domain-containing protein n=1 Tax=Mesorhizobium denitrificans TaxID=2294114 RepID=A0A371XHN2_9HYPH|nr:MULTISPECIES: DUF2147 domain-containing protein [Mesorhizobium]RFC68727.1 DUF2147 domain-containing protein [Mesorhizobium denitrificans]